MGCFTSQARRLEVTLKGQTLKRGSQFLPEFFLCWLNLPFKSVFHSLYVRTHSPVFCWSLLSLELHAEWEGLLGVSPKSASGFSAAAPWHGLKTTAAFSGAAKEIWPLGAAQQRQGVLAHSSVCADAHCVGSWILFSWFLPAFRRGLAW